MGIRCEGDGLEGTTANLERGRRQIAQQTLWRQRSSTTLVGELIFDRISSVFGRDDTVGRRARGPPPPRSARPASGPTRHHFVRHVRNARQTVERSPRTSCGSCPREALLIGTYPGTFAPARGNAFGPPRPHCLTARLNCLASLPTQDAAHKTTAPPRTTPRTYRRGADRPAPRRRTPSHRPGSTSLLLENTEFPPG